MKPVSFRNVLFLGITVLGAAGGVGLIACGSSSNPGTGGSGGGGSEAGTNTDSGGGQACNGAVQVIFSPMYTAFDGVHEYKIPAVVPGATYADGGNAPGIPATWSAADPSMVDIKDDTNIDPNNGQPIGGIMMTVRKAGTTTIYARIGSDCGQSTLTITQATPDQWQAGSDRYNNAVDPGVIRDSGSNDYSQLGCTNCHGDLGTVIKDVQHTAYQIGGYSDSQVTDVFTKGIKPPGVGQRVLNYNIWHQFHQWTMSDEQKTGIVFYLRSLEPKPQGGVTFPRPDAGMQPPRQDSGSPPPPPVDSGSPADTGTGGNDGGTTDGGSADTGGGGSDAGAGDAVAD
jgi:hypothetical protein